MRVAVAECAIAVTAPRLMTTGCVTTCEAPPENANPLGISTALRAAANAETIIIFRNIAIVLRTDMALRFGLTLHSVPTFRLGIDPDQKLRTNPALNDGLLNLRPLLG
jgi:hypothetical protein